MNNNEKSFFKSVMEELSLLRKDLSKSLKNQAKQGAVNKVKSASNKARGLTIKGIFQSLLTLVIIIAVVIGGIKIYKINKKAKAYDESQGTTVNKSVDDGVKTAGRLAEDSKEKSKKDLEAVIEHSKTVTEIAISEIPISGVIHTYMYDNEAKSERSKKEVLIEKQGDALLNFKVNIEALEKRLSPDGEKIQIVVTKDVFNKIDPKDFKLDTTKPITNLKHPEPTFINRTEEECRGEKEYKNVVDKWVRKAYDHHRRKFNDYAKNMTFQEVMAHDANWKNDFHLSAAAKFKSDYITDEVFVARYQMLIKQEIEDIYNNQYDGVEAVVEKEKNGDVKIHAPKISTPVEVVFEDSVK